MKILFDGNDSLGKPLANGVYIYCLEVYQGGSIFDRRIGKIVILR